MKKIILFVVAIIFLNQPSEAKYTQTCVAQYMTQSGWSKKYTVDVNFLSGSELNDATKTLNYSTFSVYAVIFWGEGKATVIKISNHLLCGTTVDKNCITDLFGDLKGKDQDGDEWKICTGDFCL